MKTERKIIGFGSLFGWYFRSNLLLRISAGLILGALAGLLLGDSILFIKPFGDLFVKLLKMIVVPVIFFSLITGSASIDPSRLGRVGVKIFVYYMITSAFAVAIGLLFAYMMNPGANLTLDSAMASSSSMAPARGAPGFMSIFMSLFPSNPFESLAKAEVLPVIFFSCIFGIALAHLQHSEDPKIASNAATLFKVCEGAAEAIYKLVGWILEYAPIGVFSLIAVVFAQQGLKVAGPLGHMAVAVYLALATQLLVYGLFLMSARLSFTHFLSGAREAIITAFVSRSSNGTLPVSMRNMENLGVPRAISSFTLPLGATINMNGTAIYLGISAYFISNLVGTPLSVNQMLVVILTSTLAAVGTAGIPGSGAIMLIMVLDSIGMPLSEGGAVAAAYGMILGIDAILDMGRTSMNVAGDLVGTALVAKSEGELDLSKWKK